MTSSSGRIPGPVLLPAPPGGMERGTSQTVREEKKILMVDKYFITET